MTHWVLQPSGLCIYMSLYSMHVYVSVCVQFLVLYVNSNHNMLYSLSTHSTNHDSFLLNKNAYIFQKCSFSSHFYLRFQYFLHFSLRMTSIQDTCGKGKMVVFLRNVSNTFCVPCSQITTHLTNINFTKIMKHKFVYATV
jgi:hypothetical protein